EDEAGLQIYVMSFGFKHGLPPESDLVFDVRFLPNPNYIPDFKRLTGKHQAVARYVKSFPQTVEFLDRITSLLLYLIPHYMAEGKSYLTISFGCTGGRHRSVMIAAEVQRRLKKAGYSVRLSHRDIEKE
ncbi:MAG: RNase adaptor protein RapZ, partial [Bryobacteraceae bacterium]|nr:RNase adaptor protein RapZ [Bryobacteraceae bacterium]